MNEKDQEEYLEQYKKDKEKGILFFPDALFKDAIVALIIFLLLIALSYFLGAPLEERANPADTAYTPRPEWYFLFLFQLLKYFPGQLEVLGVVLLPTLVIILLLILPFLDRSPNRYYSKRPLVIGITGIVLVGIILLTVLANLEAPPPVQASQGDQTAALFTQNCATCHVDQITVEPGTNLHEIIAQGQHEGMPAWSGDLTSDQIDALAGYVLSPDGSQIYTQNCSECHEVEQLVAGDPLKLKDAIELGTGFEPHAGLGIADFSETIDPAERTKLLNFLVAPDGQRMFELNCSSCHGKSVAFAGSEEELRQVISQGGKHLEMPAWQGTLNDDQLDQLANYVVAPDQYPDTAETFSQYCSGCHGERIPSASTFEAARDVISSGGAHETMPVWGELLTTEQLDALVNYSLQAAEGAPLEVGQELFSQYCSTCHGDFGEGGPNPTQPGDIIAPISTAEYLQTRDDLTLRLIISQGQPNLGMSPFSTSNGGPLDDDQVDSIVAFLRSWEDNPPVEIPPEIAAQTTTLDAKAVYDNLCSQCHGPQGEGGIGTSFQSPDFQQSRTDQELFDSINLGHPSTAMIGWGELLSADQIQKLVELIRNFEVDESTDQDSSVEESVEISFSEDVLPIFDEHCKSCHGNLGGWDGTSYESVMTSGNNAPVIIPGDPEGSLLIQKLKGIQTIGSQMPPMDLLEEDLINLISRWIEAGAQDN